MSSLALSLFALAGCESKAIAESRSEIAQKNLYLEISSAYRPLAACVRPFLEGDPDVRREVEERAYAFSQQDSNFQWIESQASLIIDLDRLPSSPDRRANVQAILAALAKYAADDSDGSNAARILRAKAVVISMIYFSGGTEGKCRPSVQLFQWM